MVFTSALQRLRRAGRIVALVAAAATGATGTAAAAQVLLTVETGGQARAFDLAALDALPQHSFTTTTLWTQGAVTFSGPALRDVLEAAGAWPGAAVVFEAEALNSYSVTFAPDAIEDRVPIIATRRDGKPFGPRDLGPLWVVYPYDAEVRFRSETVYAHSIWHLTRIAARPSGD